MRAAARGGARSPSAAGWNRYASPTLSAYDIAAAGVGDVALPSANKTLESMACSLPQQLDRHDAAQAGGLVGLRFEAQAERAGTFARR